MVGIIIILKERAKAVSWLSQWDRSIGVAHAKGRPDHLSRPVDENKFHI